LQCDLCLSVILLLHTKFHVNLTINHWGVANNHFQYGGRQPFWILKFWYFVTWPFFESTFVSAHQISSNSDDSWLRYCDKPFSTWRSSAILNFQNLVFWSCGLYPNIIVLLYTKFCVKRTISRWDIARKWFSIWWPPAILNLQNFVSLSRGHSWNQNLRLRANFHWNRTILGWDIAIKPFSKWRPSSILNFRKLLF